jgi:hypothetical protein
MQAVTKMMTDLREPGLQKVLSATVRELTSGVGIPATHSDVQRAAATGTSGAAAASLFGALASNTGAEGADNLARTLEVRRQALCGPGVVIMWSGSGNGCD